MTKYKYFYEGKERNLPEIAKLLGINYKALSQRIRRGMSFEEAIATPFRSGIPAYIRGSKICTLCKQDKPINSFYKLKRRGGNEFTPQCISCNNERSRTQRKNLRIDLLTHYSNGEIKCSICDEARLDVLDLDHIMGGGIKHRAGFKTPQAFYQHLKNENYPQGLRVLCRNCNWLEWIKRKDADKLDRVYL